MSRTQLHSRARWVVAVRGLAVVCVATSVVVSCKHDDHPPPIAACVSSPDAGPDATLPDGGRRVVVDAATPCIGPTGIVGGGSPPPVGGNTGGAPGGTIDNGGATGTGFGGNGIGGNGIGVGGASSLGTGGTPGLGAGGSPIGTGPTAPGIGGTTGIGIGLPGTAATTF